MPKEKKRRRARDPIFVFKHTIEGLLTRLDDLLKYEREEQEQLAIMMDPAYTSRDGVYKGQTFAGAASSKLTNPQQRIVDAIAWLESLRLYTPKRTVVAFLAGQSSKSSTFKNNLSALRSLGVIDYAGADGVKAMPVLFME